MLSLALTGDQLSNAPLSAKSILSSHVDVTEIDLRAFEVVLNWRFQGGRRLVVMTSSFGAMKSGTSSL